LAFLSKNFLLQKIGTKFYIEQDPDPDRVQNGLDPQHWFKDTKFCTVQGTNIREKYFWLFEE
jgi:hypothetical protein